MVTTVHKAMRWNEAEEVREWWGSLGWEIPRSADEEASKVK
jgi:hypothetical protein